MVGGASWQEKWVDYLESPAERWKWDPVGWVREYIPSMQLAPYQEDVLRALATPPPAPQRVVVRGPHGLGKTAVASAALLWFSLTRDSLCDWKVPTTASVWRQLEEYLWPEIHRWAAEVRYGAHPVVPRAGGIPKRYINQLSLDLHRGSAFAVASNDPARIEGAHATALMFIYDEAKTISHETFQASEGAFSTGSDAYGLREARALAISTPGERAGRFYELSDDERRKRDPVTEKEWFLRRVTLPEAIAAGRIDADWAELRKLQWGESSQVYKNRVLGEFGQADEDAIIKIEWVEAAIERWRDQATAIGEDVMRMIAPRLVACDVAREGTDLTVFAPVVEPNTVMPLTTLPRGTDTRITSDKLLTLLRLNDKLVARIDVVGVGGGVFDNCKHELSSNPLHQKRVEAFSAATKVPDTYTDISGEKGFWNLRAAAWWMLRERLDPNSRRFDATIALPPDDQLLGDLTAPHYEDREPVRKSRFKYRVLIEDKDDIRDRLGRSPDRGDTVVMALWRPPVMKPVAGVATMSRSSGWRM